jgi:cystathionine beta-lyase
MWVADMDFQPPKEVIDAISSRVHHGVFGYTYVPPSTQEAIKNWIEKRHNWSIKTSSLVYHTGVVPSISTAIQSFTDTGDSVLIQSPVYTPFFDMIEKNGRQVLNSTLKLVNHRYELDFTEFEKALKQGPKLFLMCNPHNPGGRVWTKEELLKIGELCLQYNCLILSDEIHADLVFKPNIHVPIASLDPRFKEISLTCIAPSKTFNLAGLQASVVIIPNPTLREKFTATQLKQGQFTLNTFGIVGMEAAYRYGEEWLEELLDYIKNNIEFAKSYIQSQLPNLSWMEPEGTYLLWIDCRNLNLTPKELQNTLLQKGKIALEPGDKYGPGGEGFVRINLACPRETVEDGLARIKRAFSELI